MAGSTPVAAVRAAHSLRSEDFLELWGSVRDYILIETLDNSGKPQGQAVVQLVQAFKADEDGAFATIRYAGCQDEYYQWWVENEMAPQTHHHFCRSSSIRSCRSKVGSEGIVHVMRWAPITRQEGERLLREWGLSPAHLSKKLKPVIAGEPADEGSPGVTSKAAPARPPRSTEPHDAQRDRDRERGRDRERRRRGGESEEMRSDHGRSRRRLAQPVTPPREPPPPPPKSSRKRAAEAALDAMLDQEPPDLESDKLEAAAETKLASLKEQLALKKSARADKETGAILAARAAAVAESSQKKKKKSSDVAAEVLKKLAATKKSVKEEPDFGGGDNSGDSESGSEESEDEGEVLGGRLGDRGSAANQQRKLRQYSEKHPGKLLTNGFRMMHDQIGTHYGGSANKQQALSPVMVRYLLSFALPQFQGGISQDKYRELRTIATAVDLMIEGKTSQAGDVLVQRFKSLLMGLRDGTDTASKWLELLPHDVVASVASTNEDYLARRMAVEEAKSSELLRRAAGS